MFHDKVLYWIPVTRTFNTFAYIYMGTAKYHVGGREGDEWLSTP
jgi:hypothetical protein